MKISVFQPFPGFLEGLDRLNTTGLLADRSEERWTFDDADAQIFLLRSTSDTGSLPPLAKRVADSKIKAGEEIFGRRLDAVMNGEKEIKFKFLFLDGIRARTFQAKTCKAAKSVYYDISGNITFSDVKEQLGRCEE